MLSCAQVLSSSLHGLIISDALDVPNRRMIISDNIRSSLKFADYYSAFGLAEPTPLDARLLRGNESPESLVGDYRRPDVDSRCAELLRSFPDVV
mgnify:FL=1